MIFKWESNDIFDVKWLVRFFYPKDVVEKYVVGTHVSPLLKFSKKISIK
jgi:hypothetical protein